MIYTYLRDIFRRGRPSGVQGLFLTYPTYLSPLVVQVFYFYLWEMNITIYTNFKYKRKIQYYCKMLQFILFSFLCNTVLLLQSYPIFTMKASDYFSAKVHFLPSKYWLIAKPGGKKPDLHVAMFCYTRFLCSLFLADTFKKVLSETKAWCKW